MKKFLYNISVSPHYEQKHRPIDVRVGTWGLLRLTNSENKVIKFIVADSGVMLCWPCQLIFEIVLTQYTDGKVSSVQIDRK